MFKTGTGRDPRRVKQGLLMTPNRRSVTCPYYPDLYNLVEMTGVLQ